MTVALLRIVDLLRVLEDVEKGHDIDLSEEIATVRDLIDERDQGTSDAPVTRSAAAAAERQRRKRERDKQRDIGRDTPRDMRRDSERDMSRLDVSPHTPLQEEMAGADGDLHVVPESLNPLSSSPANPDLISDARATRDTGRDMSRVTGGVTVTRDSKRDALDEQEAKREAARLALIRAYSDAWSRRENAAELWQSAAANDREIRQVATYVAGYPDPDAIAREVIAGFFADEWARANRWPWKRLAKDPGRYRKQRGDHTAERGRLTYEAAATERDAAYRRGDHTEGKRLDQIVKETYDRAFAAE